MCTISSAREHMQRVLVEQGDAGKQHEGMWVHHVKCRGEVLGRGGE